MAKEAHLIVVEGRAEEKFFSFLAHKPLIASHIALTIIKAGGGRNPPKRILERAKQEKRSKQNSPYVSVFAFLDSDRAFEGMEEAFHAENIILMTCNPRLENILLHCDNHPISEQEDAKDAFKNHFCQNAQDLNWWEDPLPCNLTRGKLETCYLLQPFWEKIPLLK